MPASKARPSFYRRDLWAAMPVYVEVWCEKDALAGVLLEETELYDVPLMVARGYSSVSFLHSAAKAIEARRQAGLHLPFRRPRSVRRRCRPRHRGQAAALRARCRNPLRAAGGDARAGRGVGPAVAADQDDGHQGQEVRRHLGRARRDPGAEAARTGAANASSGTSIRSRFGDPARGRGVRARDPDPDGPRNVSGAAP